jgi:hypothetical protein
MITRALYRVLLRMHPPAFKQQFAPEMLWLFDEAAESQGTGALLSDAFVSLLRQWLLRSECWKFPVASLFVLLQIAAGVLIVGGFRRPTYLSTRSNKDAAALGGMMRLILWSSGSVVLTVTAASLWVRKFNLRRSRMR